MKNLAEQLRINHPDGWYRVNTAEIHKHGGSSLLTKYKNSYSRLLRNVFPEYPQKTDDCDFDPRSLGFVVFNEIT